MNPFEHHGITHLSPSSINTFVAEPAAWVMDKLFGFRSKGSPSMERGTIVEAAVNGLLCGISKKIEIKNSESQENSLPERECLLKANILSDYLSEALWKIKSGDVSYLQENGCPFSEFGTNFPVDSLKAKKEKENLVGYFHNALMGIYKEITTLGMPSYYQHRVSVNFEGLYVPIIGFVDWFFESGADEGLIVDLKTTERFPSQMPHSHIRQASLYSFALSSPAKFIYVKPKAGADGLAFKTMELSGEQFAWGLSSLKNIAYRLQKLLTISRDKHEIAGLIHPDYESFYWGDAEHKAKAEEIFSIDAARQENLSICSFNEETKALTSSN